MSEVKEQEKLKKELKLIDLFSVASGAMISSGIFVLPGFAFHRAGPGVFISYFLAGLLALTGMLSQAELVSAMPRAGGSYFYIARSMGPAVGTVDGLLTWFSLSLKSAFALVGIGAFASAFADVDATIVAGSICTILLLINFLGTKKAGRAQVVMVGFLLSLMLLYIIRGVPAVSLSRFEPFTPYGIPAIISTSGFVFISYGGLLKVAALAEEAKEPGKSIPMAMILSLFVVGILYVLVVFVTTGVLEPHELSKSLTPISDGGEKFLGLFGKIAFSIAAILAFFTTANAGIMSASRYPLALSRDLLLPSFVARVHKKYNTPYVSILITGVFLYVALFLKLDVLVKVASTVMILTYIFACIAIIILRESRVQNYNPLFRAPLYPWIQVLGILGLSALIFEMGREAFSVILSLVIGGLAVYLFYGRIKANREFALLYLIQRITAKELVGRYLESELREIIRVRDDIIIDRFDRIVEKCIVLDLEGPESLEDFFKQVSRDMAERLGMDKKRFYNLLVERENESSTAITPFLAIPHIVIEGEKKFDMLIARSKNGIYFSDESKEVHAVFILAGTRDERNFHLRALSAIAQIVHDPQFEKRWMEAKSIEDLRDIILLGKRKRG